MPVRTLRVLLNRLRWDRGAEATGVVLVVLNREEGEERRESVPFAEVAAVLPAGLTVADGTFLPYHRILEVRRGGERLWVKPPRRDEREA